MKRTLLLAIATIALTLGTYYAIWYHGLSDDVARVEATLAHHNAEFRKQNRWVTLKADSVGRTGFPFAARVLVKRPTLTFVRGDETYGVSLPWAMLTERDAASGTYEVTYTPTAEALYAKSGQAPEEYAVTPDHAPVLLMRAQGDSRECSPFLGAQRCPEVGAEAPLITFAVQLPESITLTMALNGKEKKANFKLIPVNIPLYQRIPAEMDRPVEMLVLILREALIHQP